MTKKAQEKRTQENGKPTTSNRRPRRRTSDTREQRQRDAVHREVEDRVQAHLQPGTPPDGCCLVYATKTLETLQRRGFPRAILQAGSASWQIDQDEIGEMMFSYFCLFGEDAAWEQRTAANWEQGIMPEFHAWVAIPETETIIDLSFQHQRTVANRHGYNWQPQYRTEPYIWGSDKHYASKLPHWRMYYRPNRQMTLIAHHITALGDNMEKTMLKKGSSEELQTAVAKSMFIHPTPTKARR